MPKEIDCVADLTESLSLSSLSQVTRGAVTHKQGLPPPGKVRKRQSHKQMSNMEMLLGIGFILAQRHYGIMLECFLICM